MKKSHRSISYIPKISWIRPILLTLLFAGIITVLLWRWTYHLPKIKLLNVLPNSTTTSLAAVSTLNEEIRMKGKNTTWKILYPDHWTVSEKTSAPGNGIEKVLDTKILTNYKPGKGDQNGIPKDAVTITIINAAGGNGRTVDSLLDCGGKTLTCTVETISGHPFKRNSAVLNAGTVTLAVSGVTGDDLFRAVAMIYPGPDQTKNADIVDKIFRSITLSQE